MCVHVCVRMGGVCTCAHVRMGGVCTGVCVCVCVCVCVRMGGVYMCVDINCIFFSPKDF